ncbi:MAG: apolipoprotein N-acyltransferase [Acidobacteria bacterium]|jgi:apolipoprotein N-acyltransferase|nr:MAG: apolipoprotein N-acyltransferase [Acidobacteriota bacterium]
MKKLLLVFLAGLMLYLPFSKYAIWFAGLPALYILMRYRDSRFWLLGGVVFFFLSLRCVNIASVKYGGINPMLSYGMFTLFTLFLSLYQFYLPVKLLNRYFRGITLALPPLYVLFEVLRSYFPYGGFPWLILGSILVDVPFIKNSFLYSNVYLHSLFILYAVLFVAERRIVPLTLMGLLVFTLSFYSLYEKERRMQVAPALKVALVQTAVPQEDKLDKDKFRKHTDEILDLTEQALQEGVGLVVLPESALPFFYSHEYEEGYQRLMFMSFKAPILVGLVDVREGLRPYNSAYLLSAGMSVDHYDKVRLLPIGEYMPRPFGFLKEVFSAIGGVDYLPGESLKPLYHKNLKLATPICFEIAYYDLVKKLSKDANLIVVLTNDGWFDDSDCTAQHLRWARVRALESGKFVLWVNNSGYTGIIDPYGSVSQLLSYGKRAVLFGEVRLIE